MNQLNQKTTELNQEKDFFKKINVDLENTLKNWELTKRDLHGSNQEKAEALRKLREQEEALKKKQGEVAEALKAQESAAKKQSEAEQAKVFADIKLADYMAMQNSYNDAFIKMGKKPIPLDQIAQTIMQMEQKINNLEVENQEALGLKGDILPQLDLLTAQHHNNADL